MKWLFCRLEQKSFSTAEFMAAHPTLQPFTFSLFQSLWDSSVHTAYMEHLGRAGCVCVRERGGGFIALCMLQCIQSQCMEWRGSSLPGDRDKRPFDCAKPTATD